jgi:serpin B
MQMLPVSVGSVGGKNAVLSPFGLAVALYMLAGGANGATENEFRDLLGIHELPTAIALHQFGHYHDGIDSQDKEITFQSLNGLWFAADAPPSPFYADLIRNAFQAQVEIDDFSRPETVNQINAWFAQRTQDLIPQMFSAIPSDTKVVLANALYFRGQWSMPFPATATKTAPFYLADGQTVSVAMMQQGQERLSYSRAPGYEAIKLPFGEGDFEAIIALPDKDQSATTNVAQLVSSMLANEQYEPRPGRLLLPRLDLTAAHDVKAMLEALGRREMFGDTADFSKLTKSRVKVDQIVQRVALKWDEQGAEAAAGTGAGMTLMSAGREPEPFQMIVDRPFVFVLRHVKSRAIILTGLVNNPEPSTR